MPSMIMKSKYEKKERNFADVYTMRFTGSSEDVNRVSLFVNVFYFKRVSSGN